METKRDTLCAGLLAKTSILALSYPRKVLFNFDLDSQTGYDVINEITFPIHNKGNEKKYFISCVQPLGNVLKELGYPETLEDVHICQIMDKDFEKIFIESNIIRTLYAQSMDRLSNLHFNNEYQVLKSEFIKSNDEKKEDANKKKRLSKKGWV